MTFEFGNLINPIPLNDRAYFAQSFKNYYYTRFFDMIHIDKKVHRLFRDSVTIADIKYIRPGEDPGCGSCNVILTLTFRGNKIPFAAFVTEELMQDFKATTEEVNNKDISITYYQTDVISGAYIRKKDDIYKENELLIRWYGGTIAGLKKLVKAHLRTTNDNG
ncbi:MAG: hypothetical protein IPN29_08270 [Saprospiraceae bacterium]|nr:hypothetical protein [Saprospiraceae bacterium]